MVPSGRIHKPPGHLSSARWPFLPEPARNTEQRESAEAVVRRKGSCDALGLEQQGVEQRRPRLPCQPKTPGYRHPRKAGSDGVPLRLPFHPVKGQRQRREHLREPESRLHRPVQRYGARALTRCSPASYPRISSPGAIPATSRSGAPDHPRPPLYLSRREEWRDRVHRAGGRTASVPTTSSRPARRVAAGRA